MRGRGEGGTWATARFIGDADPPPARVASTRGESIARGDTSLVVSSVGLSESENVPTTWWDKGEEEERGGREGVVTWGYSACMAASSRSRCWVGGAGY